MLSDRTMPNTTRGKKFSVKINHKLGWTWKKYRNKAGTKHKKANLLHKNGRKEKKNKKTTLHLLHITVSGNRCRVPLVSVVFFAA